MTYFPFKSLYSLYPFKYLNPPYVPLPLESIQETKKTFIYAMVMKGGDMKSLTMEWNIWKFCILFSWMLLASSVSLSSTNVYLNLAGVVQLLAW